MSNIIYIDFKRRRKRKPLRLSHDYVTISTDATKAALARVERMLKELKGD